MSLLKLKQISGPSVNAPGSFVVFDGSQAIWSNGSTDGIVIPSGTTAERPQTPTAGTIRFNTETDELETYNGTDWTSLGVDTFLGLTDTPDTYVAGSSIRVNALGTGLEFFTPDEAFGDKIASDDAAEFVETQRVDELGKVVIGSNTKVVLEVEGDELNTTGERLAVNHSEGEIQLVVKDTAGTADVDLRVVPQAGGHVYFGVLGDGIVESELTFDLLVKGGNSDPTDGPGDLILSGGTALTENFNGGDVVLRPAVGFGTGVAGGVYVEDAAGTKIVDFKSSGETSGNWIEITNGTPDADPAINGVKISAALGSAAANVDLYLDPKNAGLVRVSDYSAYAAALNAAGGNDALVTKGFVLAQTGGPGAEVITAGVGLTEDTGVFNVNVGATTVGIDGSNNLIVESSAVEGQILLSSGVAGEQALWGSLDLSNAVGFSGVLTTANGGTGSSAFAQGDLLVGNAGSGLDKLALGTTGKALVSNGTTLGYAYIGTLNDTNGAPVVSTIAATTPVNNLSVKNSAAGAPVEIAAIGSDTDINVLVIPKGAGQILAKTGYTANIGSDPDTLVTKSYVDTAIQAQDEPYARRVTLSSGWASSMNIGTILPTVSGKSVLVHRAQIRVTSVITGGGVTQARIMSGSDIVMEFNENDILATGIYVADLPEAFTSTNTQLVIQFYQSNGTDQATPTGGSIEVTAYYRIR